MLTCQKVDRVEQSKRYPVVDPQILMIYIEQVLESAVYVMVFARSCIFSGSSWHVQHMQDLDECQKEAGTFRNRSGR